MSSSSGNKCVFYQRTYDGERCILMPPEDWRVSRSKFINFCLNGGRGCPVLSRYYSIISKKLDKEEK
ncbi:metal-binding protein [Vulcanisaeta sp. JCM 16159]|uniref:metal-binding protein n=1 Tax=Vulcanisaeta sp. JCM 16159 TaxID=1295371 RepID=UPI000A49C6FD|nr:metal-binding protein [Vulcanisaeta sp. JCM 16159]